MEVRNAIPTLPPLDDPGERAGNPVVAWRWIAGSCKEREGEEQGSPHGTDSPPALRVQQDVWGEASVGARRLGYGDEWVFSPPEEGRRVRWIRILSGDSHRAKARCYDFGFPGVARLSRSIGASPDDETLRGGCGSAGAGEARCEVRGRSSSSEGSMLRFCLLGRSPPFSWHRGFPR